MEDEIKNFIKVWTLAITSLSYCYLVSSKFPKGFLRLLSLLPIFYLFIILPLGLSAAHSCGVSAFLLLWLANFKLLLFAFGQGPLSQPNTRFHHFVLVSCLPIKIKEYPHVELQSKPSRKIENPKNGENSPKKMGKSTPFTEKSNLDDSNGSSSDYIPQNTKNTKTPSQKDTTLSQKSNLDLNKSILLVIKIIFLFIIFHFYNYRQSLHRFVLLAMYCCHLYIQLEIILAISAIPAWLFRFELEPQFNEPCLATSLQDFWGRRWNLMVTRILRPTVYHPVRRISSLVIGPQWAQPLGVISSFVVSGLMHEAIYYYLTRAPPTWEVTWFFVLHGICVTIEVLIKKKVGDRWRLPPVVSGLLTAVFVVVTGVWLFFAQIIRSNLDERVVRECLSLVDSVHNIVYSISGKFKI